MSQGPRPEPTPITAYAMCNGLGHTTAEVVATLREGRRGLAPCPLEVPFETVTGNVDAALPPPPSRLATSDTRTVRLALAAYDEMAPRVQQAVRRWGADRVGLIVGTSTGGIHETEKAHDRWYRGEPLPESYDYGRQHPFHAFADVLREVTGIRGPRYVVSTACSSSAKAIGSARRLMAAGVIDAAIVGGVDGLCFTTVRGFHSLGVLASEPSRPFGQDRPGMNIGEGAALLLLEREGEGAARVLGVGESSDAYHSSSPDPEGRGAALAMQRALDEAGLDASAVDHVNAHGTGTKHNDVSEAKAIVSLFRHRVPVVSTKGYTGHTLGACGATETLFALLAIEQGWIPASVGAEPIDPDVEAHVATERLEQPCRLVMSNAFAFGGNNCSVLLGAPR